MTQEARIHTHKQKNINSDGFLPTLFIYLQIPHAVPTKSYIGWFGSVENCVDIASARTLTDVHDLLPDIRIFTLGCHSAYYGCVSRVVLAAICRVNPVLVSVASPKFSFIALFPQYSIYTNPSKHRPYNSSVLPFCHCIHFCGRFFFVVRYVALSNCFHG